MRHFRTISDTSSCLYRLAHQRSSFHSQVIKHPKLSAPNRSKTLYIVSSSFSYLSRRPDSVTINHRLWNHSRFAYESTSTSTGQESKVNPTERVSLIVDEISGLTLLEVADLTEVVRQKLGVNEMPIMTMMMPGMGFAVKGSGKGGGAVKGEDKKAEKTSFDLKLEGFDAAAKIKIIKEVRTFTDLGLKEAKDLVEKAPTLLKKGVPKEEAEKIIEKMKEVGAKVVME
ncbi:50S ribosomal protein L7/L12 [Macadamia integrifolia]|uniref:50S ribosomal protein L7/L12 n=1 Tax=Macadamia integrifolia TaxID=60698 RepID=UPI001C4F6CEA|nr:50S ribosomal protein L7/L12 [Macadamia integrifolia]XP_042493178.1 50S ribosomal protein L7/L12 [Macadamia integrifolia]